MKAPIAGGTAVILASGQDSPAHIAKDAANVFWTANFQGSDSLWRVALGGGTAVLLTPSLSPIYMPGGLAVDPSNFYWTNSDGFVRQMPLSGGDAVTFNPGPSYGATGDLAVDATSIYWTSPDERTIVKAPIGGGAPTTLASSQNGIQRIAVDATSVYWTASNDGTVMKAPLDGGASVILALLQSYPTGIAVDDTGVYWTNYAGAGSCALGAVMMVSLGGGTPTILAADQLYPDGIAVDATSVYWTTGVSRDLSVYNGAVMKLAK